MGGRLHKTLILSLILYIDIRVQSQAHVLAPTRVSFGNPEPRPGQSPGAPSERPPGFPPGRGAPLTPAPATGAPLLRGSPRAGRVPTADPPQTPPPQPQKNTPKKMTIETTHGKYGKDRKMAGSKNCPPLRVYIHVPWLFFPPFFFFFFFFFFMDHQRGNIL